MRVSDAEIDAVADELGLDRMTAYRHCRSRKLAREQLLMEKRAALTVARSSTGRVDDSPPGPSAPPLRLAR